jgi:electron transfer flavoprotein-quinone oxidoreductase
VKSEVKATEIIETFKKTPLISELVKGGVVKEYSARLIPEGGFSAIPKLYSDGVLVAGSAAGLVINNGVVLRGVDLAVASGIAAANTVRLAKENGDTTQATLSKYKEFLREQFVIQDLMTFKNAPNIIADSYLYEVIPKLACALGKRIYEVGDGPQQKIRHIAKKTLKENTSIWEFLKWAVKAGRSL